VPDLTEQRDLPARRGVARGVVARTKLLVSALAGGLAGAAAGALTDETGFSVLVGWDVAAGVYMAWVWLKIWRLDAERTASIAVAEDPTRATSDAVTLGAAVASLAAVGVVLASAAQSSGATQFARLGLGLASVVISWGVVHTVFTLLYARLYYTGIDGGVDFNQPAPPTYADFAYLSFTIGMTFQVSDTALEDREIRKSALHHALLSFLFSTGILATTVNLVASISSK
jgi:uncharacterized membrane protein